MIAVELKTGSIFKEHGTPFVVLKYAHIKMARGGATVRVKVRDLLTGSVLEKSYASTNKVDDAYVSRKNAQYLYKDTTGFVFMEPDTYVQFTLTPELVENNAKYLLEGEFVQVLYFEGTPISIELPNSMIFEIAYTEPGFRGNTVSNAFKDATLQNGTVAKVPPFIKIGDKVKIDTRTGDYVSKA